MELPEGTTRVEAPEGLEAFFGVHAYDGFLHAYSLAWVQPRRGWTLQFFPRREGGAAFVDYQRGATRDGQYTAPDETHLFGDPRTADPKPSMIRGSARVELHDWLVLEQMWVELRALIAKHEKQKLAYG